MVHRRVNFEGKVLNYIFSYLEDRKIPGRLAPLTTNSGHTSSEEDFILKSSYSD